jgi:hypothetical protein
MRLWFKKLIKQWVLVWTFNDWVGGFIFGLEMVRVWLHW